MHAHLTRSGRHATGLDAAAAFYVMSVIKNLASRGRTIISVIHQPSSEVWPLLVLDQAAAAIIIRSAALLTTLSPPPNPTQIPCCPPLAPPPHTP